MALILLRPKSNHLQATQHSLARSHAPRTCPLSQRARIVLVSCNCEASVVVHRAHELLVQRLEAAVVCEHDLIPARMGLGQPLLTSAPPLSPSDPSDGLSGWRASVILSLKAVGRETVTCGAPAQQPTPAGLNPTDSESMTRIHSLPSEQCAAATGLSADRYRAGLTNACGCRGPCPRPCPSPGCTAPSCDPGSDPIANRL